MSDEKTCPFCAETIKAAAVKCRHCGEMLNRETDWRGSYSSVAEAEGRPSPFRPVEKPTDHSALAFPSIVATIGVVIFAYALSMDTSVSTEFGRVSNLSLMSQQANMRMAGGLIAILGLAWAAFNSQKK